jgi:SAM-dependent methyltransferase
LSFIKLFIKENVPSFIFHYLNRIGVYKNYIPSNGKVRHGDFLRKTPFSVKFGYDRGGPIDRYYIEQFLQTESATIRGRVLEIGDNNYTIRFGGEKVIQSDILHIDSSNPGATFIGDLSTSTELPSDSFDCVILTQTLHLIYHYNKALENCMRILKPRGTLLITVPGISHIAQDQWRDYWLWSFTESSMTRMLSEIFSKQNITINTHGNVLVAASFLYGMGLPEISKENRDYHDPCYQVIITAKAVKMDEC